MKNERRTGTDFCSTTREGVNGNMYTPDKWLMIKINSPRPFYKILGSWSGGYLDGDSWRMNSSVVSFKEEKDYYLFYGSSGSCYKCSKHSYGVNTIGAQVAQKLKNKYPDKISFLDEDTDFTKLDYN